MFLRERPNCEHRILQMRHIAAKQRKSAESASLRMGAAERGCVAMQSAESASLRTGTTELLRPERGTMVLKTGTEGRHCTCISIPDTWIRRKKI